MLNMLEELLSITGRFRPQMDAADRHTVQRLSAETSDLREDLDGNETLADQG
jgi:hypothetical protein